MSEEPETKTTVYHITFGFLPGVLTGILLTVVIYVIATVL